MPVLIEPFCECRDLWPCAVRSSACKMVCVANELVKMRGVENERCFCSVIPVLMDVFTTAFTQLQSTVNIRTFIEQMDWRLTHLCSFFIFILDFVWILFSCCILILFNFIYFILFYFILFYLFYFILFYFILFYFILFYFILFYFIYFILFYFILFYLI